MLPLLLLLLLLLLLTHPQSGLTSDQKAAAWASRCIRLLIHPLSIKNPKPV
jgi:hypothetical protein